MKYISFDNYYKQSDYNNFIMSAFNNGVQFKEYISIKPPYNWWLAINDENVPKFLDYDETKDTRFFVSKITPRYPNEEFILRRKDNDPKTDIRRFIENDVLAMATKEKFVGVFIFQGTKIREYSTQIDAKLYILGQKGMYKVGVCFNPYIQNVVDPADMILTINDGDWRGQGEIEQRINYLWKPQLKLSNKTIESSYFYKGEYNMIHRPLIKLS